MTRNDLALAKRVVVKIGSSSLTSADAGINLEAVESLVDELAALRADGRQIVLVSSGAIAAGLAPLGFTKRPKDLASQQAAASIGQGLLIAHYTKFFAAHDTRVGQVLLTVHDLSARATYSNALSTMSRLLRLNAVPIVNENDTVATHEIRFGDNDRLAALVAHLVGASALVLCSDVDGLYTAHPQDPAARFIDYVDDVQNLRVDTSKPGHSGVGTGGMTTKLHSAEIAASAGIPVVLTRPEHVGRALRGELVGTYIAPSKRRPSRKLLWLAHGAHSTGRLFLDAGAVEAIRSGKASLLAAGIVALDGDFLPGDPVDIIAPDGHVVARGLVNVSSEELARMAGKTSAEIARIFGEDVDADVVHKDVLIVLSKFQQTMKTVG